MDSKIKIYLDRLIASPRRPSSLLFVGPEETGKGEAVFYLISKLAGKAGDADFERRAKEKNHPDVIFVEPEIVEDKKGRAREKEIGIAQVRDALERMKFFPYETEKKFCVFKKAEKMNAEASNALLKSLEEPSGKAIFALLATDVGTILPTIVSRCAILRFPKKDLPVWKEENRERLKSVFKEEIFEKFDYIEKISKNKSEMISVLKDWESVMAGSLRKLVAENRANQENRAKIKKVVGLTEKTREALNRLERTNANPRAVGEKLVLGMG